MRSLFRSRSLVRWLLPVLLVAALSADAVAGPLARLRERRQARTAGGCTSGVATGSCAGGKCSAK